MVSKCKHHFELQYSKGKGKDHITRQVQARLKQITVQDLMIVHIRCHMYEH